MVVLVKIRFSIFFDSVAGSHSRHLGPCHISHSVAFPNFSVIYFLGHLKVATYPFISSQGFVPFYHHTSCANIIYGVKNKVQSKGIWHICELGPEMLSFFSIRQGSSIYYVITDRGGGVSPNDYRLHRGGSGQMITDYIGGGLTK